MINISSDDLKNVVTRLENIAKTLESSISSKSSNFTGNDIQSAMLTTEKIATLGDYWSKVLRNLLELKTVATDTKIPELETLSDIVCESLCAHQDLLIASEKFQKPMNNDAISLNRRLLSITSKVQDISKLHKNVVNHCEAVKNGLDALCWIFQDSNCESVTQMYFENIDIPGNRIFKEKIPEQSKWVRAFKAVIKEVNDLVNKNYKGGLSWNGKGEKNSDQLFVSIGSTYRENFKKGIKTENTLTTTTTTNTKQSETKHENPLLKEIAEGFKLKPVHKDEKCDKGEKKDEHKANAFDLSKVKKGLRMSVHKKGKTEKFEEGRNSWFLQNFEDETKVFDAEKLENKTSILISNCINCTFDVPKKVNKIGLTNCENVKIIMESLISQCEITNSKKLEISVKGTVNSFSVDSTDGVIVLLSPSSAEAQFYSAKSSDILIRIQKNDDPNDYNELVIPEQFVFTINKERTKLEAKVSDLYGY